MSYLYLIVVFALPVTFISAQEQPTLVAPDIISTGGVFGFTLSPDGKEAFWVQSGGKRDTLIIMRSQFVKEKWTTPSVASFSTSTGTWKDIDPVFSPNGKMILFQSTRPVEGKPNRKGFDIWAVKKTNEAWGKAFHLGNNINSDDSESYASISKQGDIYFMKNNGNGIDQSDIYRSRLANNEYQLPENLGAPINTKERESNPFIFPDGNTLIYFSSDPQGLGDVDLYISHKQNGKWTTPKNLGAPINSELAEFCPFYHKKQKRLYFARQRKEGNRFIENIYFFPLSLWKG